MCSKKKENNYLILCEVLGGGFNMFILISRGNDLVWPICFEYPFSFAWDIGALLRKRQPQQIAGRWRRWWVVDTTSCIRKDRNLENKGRCWWISPQEKPKLFSGMLKWVVLNTQRCLRGRRCKIYDEIYLRIFIYSKHAFFRVPEFFGNFRDGEGWRVFHCWKVDKKKLSPTRQELTWAVPK